MALPVPGAVGREVAHRLGALRHRHPQARWIPEPMLHCTVVFLGKTPEVRVPDVMEAMASAVDGSSLARLTLGGAGGSPHRGRSAVAWLNVTEGADQVRTLAIELDRRLRSAGFLLGSGPVAGTRAHVTVARRVSAPLQAELRALGSFDLSWGVSEVVLLSSILGRDGSRYEPLHRVSLGAG